jgi:uncharacterized protein DUF6058
MEVTRNSVEAELAQYSSRDLEYIRSRFVTLEDIASRCGVSSRLIRDWQRAALFPAATYSTPDGMEWYSPGYCLAVRRALRRNWNLRRLFLTEFRAALASLRKRERDLYDAIIQEAAPGEKSAPTAALVYWKDFLSGRYGACLRLPWIPCMIQKERLVGRIGKLVLQPNPTSPAWAGQLRQSVNALDRLELPFSDWDRVRFGGSVTRDIFITRIKERFPALFESELTPPASESPQNSE